MSISAQQVKALRDRTGAGMMECKKALEEADGDMEAAIDILRAKGAAKAAKRVERAAKEGVIGSYLHFGGKVGVMVEVNCETDFVAKTEAFRALAKDLAMHIAASNPMVVSLEDFPPEVVERERKVYLGQVKNEGKPESVAEKIVEGKLRKFLLENSLLSQPFVKDPVKTVGDLVTEVSAKTGEKIRVSRFVRFQVGEGG